MVLIVIIVLVAVAAILGVIFFLGVFLKSRKSGKNNWRQLAKDLKGNGEVLSPRDLSNIYVKYNHKLVIPTYLGFTAGKNFLKTAKLPSKYSHLVDLILNSPSYDELTKIIEGEKVEMKNEAHPISNKQVKFYHCVKIENEQKLLKTNSGEFISWQVGRDLQTDFKVSIFIDFLNAILKDCEKKIVIEKQKVFPSGKDRGFIEYFENVQPLSETNLRLKDEKLLSSVAGIVLLRLILGVKEFEQNIFVSTNPNGKQQVFQRNFVFQKVTISDSSITFNHSLVDQIKSEGKADSFVSLLLTGFKHLILAKNLVYAYGNTLFGNNFVNYFAAKSSLFEQDSHTAQKQFADKLNRVFDTNKK